MSEIESLKFCSSYSSEFSGEDSVETESLFTVDSRNRASVHSSELIGDDSIETWSLFGIYSKNSVSILFLLPRYPIKLFYVLFDLIFQFFWGRWAIVLHYLSIYEDCYLYFLLNNEKQNICYRNWFYYLSTYFAWWSFAWFWINFQCTFCKLITRNVHELILFYKRLIFQDTENNIKSYSNDKI